MIQNKMGRKVLTTGVVVTTVLWSMMATALVAPLKASAAGCVGGTLIKGSLAAVYYCGNDGKRYVFPNEKTYMTWYSDFSSVTKISDADLASLQIGGNITYRPGVKMVKITTDPKVYAVSKGGVLRPIASESAAVALYGSTWNKMIDDVADAFFTNYSIGSAVSSASDFDKAAELSAAQSINVDKNLGGASSATGTIVAQAAADMPSAMTLTKGAMGVNMAKFTLKNNGSTDATVNSLTVKRVGPGATTDFSAVYVYEGASRLTTGRTINSSTNEAIFTGLNLVLKGGETRTLWVAADVSTTAAASNVHHFEVVSVQAGSATMGGLPIVGPNMTISGASVGSLTIARTGSISNPKLGQTNVKVSEFSIAAGSSEDVWFQRLTMYQAGNLSSSNFSNFKLMQAGNVVATATTLDSRMHIVFNLASPMLIEKGATKNFEVYADVGGSARANDTIKLYVEEDADVYGVGSTYGQGVSVVRTSFDNSAANGTDASWSTVEGGQVTLAFNGPASKNVASNSKDVEIFNFSMTAQANVEVKKVMLTVDCAPGSTTTAGAGGDQPSGCKDSYSDAAGNANYTDIKIVDTTTGQVWWGPQDLASLAASSDTTQDLTFTEVWTLAAGSTHTFKVTADVRSTVPSNDTVKVTLKAFGSTDLRSLDNNTFVATTDIVPSGALAGNQHTIVAPSLVISLGSSPVSGSYVKGSTAVPFLGMNLKAGDGAAIKVTSMTLKAYIDDAGTTTLTQGYDAANGVAVADDVLSCKLFDGSTQVGETKSPTTSTAEGSGGLLQFSSLNLTVPAATTKSLQLKCDLSNSAYRNSNAETLGVAVANADVSAQDPDGNALVAGTNLTGSANASAATVRITVTNTGTMTYALAPDDSESEASLVVAGNANAVLGKIRLTAANEELKQTKLRVALVTAGNYTSLASMSLYDGSTLVAGPVPVDSTGIADFTGMNFVVPKNASKTLTVKAAVNAIADGATSDHNLKVTVDLTNPTAGTFEYRGTQSSTVVTTINTADVTGRDKMVRKTVPTVSLASLPTSVMSNGAGVIVARFTVKADAAENISLKKLAFKGAISGTAQISTPAIREVGQSSDIAATVSSATGSSNCGFTADDNNVCIRVVFTNEQQIQAGQSKTYELRMTTANFDSTESLSTSLLGDSALATDYGALTTAAPDTQVDGVQANFIWSDNAAIPHLDTIGDSGATDWSTGYLVKVLPADAQTLTRS